ncbi:MAG: putative metalloprotease CJM1_0395 family protein [Gammaproteobacteria bacterium]|nr:putative metalloprotease CJM1_0395 family protein [Gammaproteobacteria bacterium]
MNIANVSSSYLQTTHQGHSAPGLQPNATPVAQAESLTRINSTQNTANSENKPNTQQQDQQNAGIGELLSQKAQLGRNTKDYKQRDEQRKDENKGTLAQEQSEKPVDNPAGLDEDDLEEVKELASRDREVRAHEAAHLAAAGQYAKGGINLETKRGPDGKSYAVGGHVSIDTSPVPNDPEATLRKAQKIRAAAIAPAEPSGQDRSVAIEAARMASEARMEITKEKQEEIKQTLESKDKTTEEASTPTGSEQARSRFAQAYENVAGIGQFDTEETRFRATA